LELQCQFQAMSPVIYAPQMKVIHAFGGTFPITEEIIYTFLYYYAIDNRTCLVPNDVVMADNINLFKKRLDKFWSSMDFYLHRAQPLEADSVK